MSAYSVQAEAQVRTERATPEKIVGIADQIWERIRGSGIAEGDHAQNDQLLGTLQNEFKDFGASFPLILRWMVQVRRYSRKALKLYLLQHATADLSTREGFLALQAEYLVLLYREDNAHVDENRAKQYRESIVAQLLKEDEEFKRLQAEVDAEVAKSRERMDRDRREALRAYLLAKRAREEEKAEKPNA